MHIGVSLEGGQLYTQNDLPHTQHVPDRLGRHMMDEVEECSRLFLHVQLIAHTFLFSLVSNRVVTSSSLGRTITLKSENKSEIGPPSRAEKSNEPPLNNTAK
jgi:hypothetical protein